MSRFFRALVIVLLAASCGGGGGTSAPRNLDNACSILQQRPGYLRAFRAAERKWGVPVHVQMAAMYQESKFKSDARTPFRYTLGVIPMGRQSSAYGYSQALNGTWDEYVQDQRKFRAKRNDINDAADFMGWYMAESNRRLGISLADARNQYLAYHEGRTGFSRGSYNSKAWLLRVSDEIAARAFMYQGQLASCPVRS
ncbi:transglycosylase SLT domain-containing protein [uncultured Marivita sp.]|uniref:transglycosylase SLT domain-containing protein n=1 Tax=uncultured Marivita sp. TaxID=888080 RepID=UPI0026246EF7|nr:transglycosylase SLT domain-containing protein [uncultured Marivita sp.]